MEVASAAGPPHMSGVIIVTHGRVGVGQTCDRDHRRAAGREAASLPSHMDTGEGSSGPIASAAAAPVMCYTVAAPLQPWPCH